MNSHPYRPAACYLLFGCLLAKIVGLELLVSGAAHHAVEGVVLLAMAFAAGVVAGSWRASGIVLFLLGAGWTLDYAGVPTSRFDFESMCWCLGHSYVAVLLMRLLHSRDDIERLDVVDTISLYLVAGIAFTDFYSFILSGDPAAFRTDTPGPPGYDTVLYFSFVTQATLGYGDIVPVHRLARAAAIFQSLFGVLFMAIVVARIVSAYAESRRRRAATPPSAPTPSPGAGASGASGPRRSGSRGTGGRPRGRGGL